MLNKLILSVVVIIILALLRSIAGWISRKRITDVKARYRTGKFATYTITILGLFFLASIWFTGFRNISTYLGLVSAGLAIALKDMLASIAGWFYILARRPFEVGDRIAIGEHAGDIIDQRLFRFSMLEIGNWVASDQSTGRVIHIPNSLVFTSTIANYTSGFSFIWNELPILVTFESDWKKAKKILTAIGERHGEETSRHAERAIARAARRQMIMYARLGPKVWTSVADCGVLLTMRYLCDPRQRRSTAETIWENVLDEFAKADDIDFAYPTIRRFLNPDEGKPETGGPAPQGASNDE
jgi:small-conductance mechanosensitive channel